MSSMSFMDCKNGLELSGIIRVIGFHCLTEIIGADKLRGLNSNGLQTKNRSILISQKNSVNLIPKTFWWIIISKQSVQGLKFYDCPTVKWVQLRQLTEARGRRGPWRWLRGRPEEWRPRRWRRTSPWRWPPPDSRETGSQNSGAEKFYNFLEAIDEAESAPGGDTGPGF